MPLDDLLQKVPVTPTVLDGSESAAQYSGVRKLTTGTP
jgi:hypothetical protein